MSFKRLQGVDAALNAADERKKEEQETVQKQMRAGEKADLPPPPENFGDAPKQKKKKRTDALPPLDGEILEPPVRPKPKLEYRAPQQEIGPSLVFPLGTDEKIFRLARYGMKPEVIARHIDNPLEGKPISTDILMRYFGEEVRHGARVGAEETAKSIHEQVTGANGVKRNAAAAMFRAKQDELIGFKETTEVVHTTKEAELLRQRIEELSEQDILQLRAILAKRIDAGNAATRTPRVQRRADSDEDAGQGSEREETD